MAEPIFTLFSTLKGYNKAGKPVITHKYLGYFEGIYESFCDKIGSVKDAMKRNELSLQGRKKGSRASTGGRLTE